MELKFQKVELPRIQALNFIMSPVELKDYLDYEVKRVYYVTKPTGPTGAHCHLVEKEFFIMVQGSCVATIDQGNGIEDIPLAAPTSAIYVGNFVWHGFKDFSDDAIFLALSSTNYSPDRSDYIEDYDKYKETLKGL